MPDERPPVADPAGERIVEPVLQERLRLLEAANTRAQERILALQTLSRRFAHALQQPVSCIVGYAALLTEEDLHPDESRDCINQLAQAAERLSLLIREHEAAYGEAGCDIPAAREVRPEAPAAP